jgi:hypothetical protein
VFTLFKESVPQLILWTKRRKEAADRDAINCLKRVTRWAKKELKRERTSRQDVDFNDSGQYTLFCLISGTGGRLRPQSED